MGWLEDRHKENADRIKAIGVKAGNFIQLITQFGDVWSEVAEVRDNYCLIYKGKGKYSDEIAEKLDWVFFYNIRFVVNKLPETAGIVITKNRKYSYTLGNLKECPNLLKSENTYAVS
jgi:hypothetical protein